MSSNQKDYVSIIYNEKDRPLTTYPGKLSGYLFQRFDMCPGESLLDVGCGRGEFLSGFIDQGMAGFAVDQSNLVENLCPSAKFRAADLANQAIPFEDNFFDFVYSKSVIEHFYFPEKLISEIYRVLKPGGRIITLCPSWEHNFKIYFEDYTLRTPFMKASLRDIHLINGFENVSVEFFRQLPIVWRHSRIFSPLSELTRILIPDFMRTRSKWIRFSKEIMLLASATKPYP